MSLRDIACDVGECKRNTSQTHTMVKFENTFSTKLKKSLFSFVFLIGRRHYYNWSNSRYLTGELEGVFVFFRSVKARASFVGEITMTSYLSRWIAQLEMPEKSEKSRLLCVSPCILRIALCVKTTLVANANAILIPSAAMSTDLCFAPAFLYRSVTSYDIVIAYAPPAKFSVPSINLCSTACLVRTDGRTMYDD